MSPPGPGSILTTSAPRSASTIEQNGPDNARLSSTTLIPCNACIHFSSELTTVADSPSDALARYPPRPTKDGISASDPFNEALFRQCLMTGLDSKRQDQQANHKGRRCPRNRQPERTLPMNRGGQQEVHPSAEQPAHRCIEGKCGSAYPRRVLLRQPQREDREIAAEEAEEQQRHHEQVESVRQIEDPAEGEYDRHGHAGEVHPERRAPPQPFRQPRRGETPEDRPDRQHRRPDRRKAY